MSPFDRTAQTLPPPDPSSVVFEVFLIGDAGGATDLDSEPALRLLKQLSSKADSNSAVVFLGDNIYCCGMPDSASEGREWAEMRATAQANAVKDFDGRVFFIPGNHDWGGALGGRVQSVREEERFIESLFEGQNVFRPDDGLPGPIDVKLNDGLRLVLLDTQWWMTDDADKPYGESGSSEIKEDADFILELDDILSRRRNDHLLIVGHHPIRSNGSHGGRFSLKDHLFPLTAVVDGLYLPLPVIGSLYPILRRIGGGPQDFSNQRYASYRASLDAIFKDHEGRVVYASGHDHNLQYFSEGSIQHIVSGSGSSSEYVAPGNGARFTSNKEGLMKVSYLQDGSIWLEAIAYSEKSQNGELLFRTEMSGPVSPTLQEPVLVDAEDVIDIPVGATERHAANGTLEAGGLRRFFFGSDHREAWAREWDIPVFDIGREAGGLTPIKRGGSLQTTSVRLQNDDGRQFVLRSVNKDPTRSLPPGLRETIAANISIDQIAIMHPYGAPVVAALADAVGVYHANPKYVFVPDDPRFGPYREVVAGQLMMFEERPDEDMSHAPSFGRSEDVIGTISMTRKITDDNDNRVDGKHFARSRLLDMYLSDWDRHSDQWRWASFPADGYDGTTYRAIPRDRDWAFNQMEGLFPSIAKLRYFIPKFQDFRETYGYLPGLNTNGMHLDRRFTSELTREDWIAIARDIQVSLTDEVIDAALLHFPEEIREIYASEYRRLLKVRRDALDLVAERYYEFISRLVDVVGSDKHERFEITRTSDGNTDVVVFKTSKEGEIRRELFRRTFLGNETKEIRLYGLGGNDTFIFEGPSRDGIRIRAIGGPGSDRFSDRTDGAGSGNGILVYDVPNLTEIDAGPSTRLRISSDPLVNLYNRKEFGYTKFMPSVYPGANQDDGIFFGGGGTFTLYGFRRLPYGSRHTIRANISTRTQAFNMLYGGRFVDRINGWDIGLEASAKTPNNIRNYFGLGNESENSDENAEFYQARFSEFKGTLSLLKPTGNFFEFSIGPTFEFTDIKQDSLRFVGQPQSGIASSSFEDQVFAGIESGFFVDGRDSPVFPRHGLLWQNALHLRFGLHESSSNFVQLRTDFSFYATPPSLQLLTMAFRAGARHTLGDFPFYMANTLGGKHNLRGWRSTRFAGRSALYQNVELRAELFRYSTLLAAGSAGLLAFLDNGRVFTDEERSSAWHQGYGVGFWMNLFDMSVFSGTIGFSEEETAVTIGMGLFF